MIMLSPNKNRVTTIVASIRKSKQPSTEYGSMGHDNGSGDHEEYSEAPTSDSMAAKVASMDSFNVAMEKKDGRGMARALETFLSLCSGGDEDSGEKMNPKPDDVLNKNPYMKD